MATKYRLPCHDDAFVAVDASQAGLAVTCPCGKEVQVPTWRELSQLDRVEADGDADTARQRAAADSTWSPQNGLIFLSIVVLIASGASAGYWYKTMPTERPIFVNYEGIRDHVDALTLTESMADWDELRGGIPKGELPPMQYFLDVQEAHWRWTYVSLGGCVVGVLLGIVGIATAGQSGNKPRRPAR